MAMVLPQEINFAQIPSLPPNTTSREVVLQPINGAIFQPGTMIEIQFPNAQGEYLDPASLYYRMKINVTNTGTAASVMGTDFWRGAPALTAFSKVETYSGSQQLESIHEYGVITNDLSCITMDQAQRYGQAYNLGLQNSVTQDTATVPGDFSADYGLPVIAAGGNYDMYVAFPVLNCLSQADKLIPLGRMGNVVTRFTTEIASNVLKSGTGATVVLNYTISNFELCYTSVHMSDEVEQMLYASGDKFYIKSSGWASTANSISAGTNGQIELSFPLRYSSIKSLFAHFSPSYANAVNGKYDSVALQNTAIGTGQARYQFTVNSVPILSRELDTLYNPAGILCELRKAVGGLSSKTNSMSISPTEFKTYESSTTTSKAPGRHIVGVNCETLPGASGSLLTGISSSASNITFRALCNVTNIVTVLVYANYDLLLEVDPVMRSVIAKF